MNGEIGGDLPGPRVCRNCLDSSRVLQAYSPLPPPSPSTTYSQTQPRARQLLRLIPVASNI